MTDDNRSFELFDKFGELIETIYFEGNVLMSNKNFYINQQIRALRKEIKELQKELI